MNKNRTRFRSIILKAVCLGLAVFTGGPLFAPVAMATGACGMQCCCQIGPATMHHGTPSHLRFSMDCCSGVSLNPCGLHSALAHKLPEVIPASCCRLPHVTPGPALILSESLHDSRHSGGYFIFQFTDQKFNPPPLYLQHHSYLI